MNVEALIAALMANLGDPNELVEKAKSLNTGDPEDMKKSYILLGKAAAHQNTMNFINRLKQSMEAEKQESQKKKEQESVEDLIQSESQYKAPTGKHLRNQTSFPASFSPSKSFGGVLDTGGKAKKKKKTNLEQKIDELFELLLAEEIAIKSGENTALAAGRGQFIVDGDLAISNHADILRILVTWLIDNRPEVMQSAVDGIANMVRSGTIFR